MRQLSKESSFFPSGVGPSRSGICLYVIQESKQEVTKVVLFCKKYEGLPISLKFDGTCSINPHQGPVVQSIVSLTSSLRGQLIKCFTTL